MRLARQSVLADRSGPCDQADVRNRVATDQKQVGERTLPHDADAALIRLAFAGSAQQFVAGAGGHHQHLGRRLPVRQADQKRSFLFRKRTENRTSVPNAVMSSY